MKRILIPTKLDPFAADLLETRGFDVVLDSETDFDALIAANPDTSALIVRSEKVAGEVMERLPKLRLIVRAGAGYNTIDVKEARRRGIDVMNTPGANSNAVAEEVIALILAGYRHVVPADISTRAGKWEKKSFMGTELSHKTVGIVGLGNIGQLLVKRLRGFDVTVLAFDPMLTQSKADELGIEMADVARIFAESDIVSLHVPENDHTRGMINAELVGSMKNNAMIVNCARAGVVDEDALRMGKAEKGLIYCNDVYPQDAAGEKSIADVADVMLPHIGASTKEANLNAATMAAEQVADFFEKGVRRNVVNSATPEGLDEEYQLLSYYLAQVAHGFLGGAPVTRVEVSLYGGLDQFADSLKAPIVLGMHSQFDTTFELGAADTYLTEKGVDYFTREADDSKGYGKAVTVDLIAGIGNDYRRCSVRGSIAEGKPMVTRIDDFDKLYFEPVGTSILAVYRDKPGVLASIAGILGERGINIEDIRAPHDSKGEKSMAVLLTGSVADQTVLNDIQATTEAYSVASLNIG